MDKQEKLTLLARTIENCIICKKDSIGKMVFGEGDINAKVMFVGEAPGKTEAQTGRPFIGRSGKFLRSFITSIGLNEKDVYITSPVKYLPARGTPSVSQINHAREHFLEQVEIINPNLLVLMGSVAIQGALGEKIPVTKIHGSTIGRNGREYFITFHPAAAMRFPPLRKEITADFEKLQKIVARL